MAIALAIGRLFRRSPPQGVGTIGGNVVDSSGAALQGVTLSVNSCAGIDVDIQDSLRSRAIWVALVLTAVTATASSVASVVA